jgi:hypothetical protein
MRKLYLGSIALIVFSLSGIAFQLSCAEDAISQNGNPDNYILPAATTTTLGGVVVGSGLTVDSDGMLSVSPSGNGSIGRFLYVFGIEDSETVEYWTAKNDGTDNKQIPITLPAGLNLVEDGHLTPDGNTLIFTVEEASADEVRHIYSVAVDGTNLKKLIDGAGKTGSAGSKYFTVNQTY